ncbi:MAG: hypothetical protein QGD89_05415 [Actinomycetota bacterium]|nr:hypothetical protein [Actinomycetota bacterium]
MAHAPKLRAIPKVEQQAWTAQQLQGFLRAAASHRLFPALWLISTTGACATPDVQAGRTHTDPPARPQDRSLTTAGVPTPPTVGSRLSRLDMDPYRFIRHVVDTHNVYIAESDKQLVHDSRVDFHRDSPF